MSDVTPIYAAPKQLGVMFNIKTTTLWRLENGRHRNSAGFPRAKTLGGRRLYDVAKVRAWFETLPEDGSPRQPPKRKRSVS